MRRLTGVVVCAALAVGGYAAGSAGHKDAKALKADSLAFMAGAWERDEGLVKMEEHWTAPQGGCLMGMFRQVNGEKKLREFEVIEETADGVMMTIKHFTPDLKEIPGRVLVRKLVSVTSDEAVFETTGDEPKQKIVYKRSGDTLNAKVELLRNGKVVTLDIPFTKMARR